MVYRITQLHSTLASQDIAVFYRSRQFASNSDASQSEMLLDDSVRYVNKARLAGSPLSIQVWHGLIHVWHIFVAHIPEAQQAFTEIEPFLKKHARQA